VKPLNFKVEEFLRQASANQPSKIAFIADNRRISYRDLDNQVARLAASFDSLGVKHNTKVALLSQNSLDWFLIELALIRLGAILVPVNTRFKRTEIQYVLNQSDSTFLVVEGRNSRYDYFESLRGMFPALQKTDYQIVTSHDQFPSMRHIVSNWGSNRNLTDVLVSLSSTSQVDHTLNSNPDDIVLIQYTSGTTSFPKGVMLSQQQIVRNAFNLGARIRLDHDDLLFSGLPFAHVGGSVLTNLLAITRGAGVLTMGNYSADGALALIQKYRPTAINGIDSHFIDIYTNPNFKKELFPPIKKGWLVGSPEVVKHVIEDMGVSKIANVYGLSEASPNVTASDYFDSDFLRCNRQGITYKGMQIRIVDPLTNKILPRNSIGEIQVRGYSVMRGYYNKPEETAAVIDNEGWLHTGDQGFIDKQDYLAFTGRLKDVLRVGGENVSPAEVEDLLLTYPNVRRAAVVGVPDSRLGEVCFAFVELRNASIHFNAQDLIEFCKANLASFKVPRVIQLVDSMPMTESGKIQKFRLKELALKDATEMRNMNQPS
jgi:acyl-CoA synthetase (AMP-forming)/AMP-acid ligase II